MKTKIKWFKEVLELEPGSKVFFPLARMYYEDGLVDEAEETLLQGLERNPDHLEARFLLVEILSKQDETIRAADEVVTITKVLSRYPSFWRVWSENAAPSSRDSAMALSFLAANFQGRPISWSQVIAKGLDALVSDGRPLSSLADEGPESGADVGPSTRTRTMADLLAEQGDHQEALDIYEELLAGCEPGAEGDLPTRIALMRAELGLDDEGDPSAGAAAATASSSLDETVANFLADLAPAAGADEDDEDDAPDFDELAELEVAPDFDEVAAEVVEEGDDSEGEADLALDGLDDLDAAVEGLDDLVAGEEPAVEAAAEEPEVEAVAEAAGDEAAAPETDGPAPMPGKEQLMQTLEALADRLEARSAL